MEIVRRLAQLSTWKKFTWVAILILIILVVLHNIAGSHYCKLMDLNRKVEYICFEEPDKLNRTGIESVKPLPVFYEQNYIKVYKPSKRREMNFSLIENNRIKSCIDNYKYDQKKGHDGFWSGDQQEIRRTHHKYLMPNKNILVEVGGNVGEDAQVYLDMYKPKHFVILEPLKLLHHKLQQRFKNYTNVFIYNVGLGARYEKFMIKMEGNVGDATSPFFGSGEGTCSLKVVNAIDFFKKLGVGNFKVDLLTINCEGCEFDLLETLISTDMIYQFKNIQFGTHPTLKNLPDPVGRYCRIQEWLKKSHRLTYQYKFTWETWRLKDL